MSNALHCFNNNLLDYCVFHDIDDIEERTYLLDMITHVNRVRNTLSMEK